MFDFDMDDLYTRICRYEALNGKSPKNVLMSQQTVDFLNEKIKYELNILHDEKIKVIFGIEIEIDNSIKFCRAEITQ